MRSSSSPTDEPLAPPGTEGNTALTDSSSSESESENSPACPIARTGGLNMGSSTSRVPIQDSISSSAANCNTYLSSPTSSSRSGYGGSGLADCSVERGNVSWTLMMSAVSRTSSVPSKSSVPKPSSPPVSSSSLGCSRRRPVFQGCRCSMRCSAAKKPPSAAARRWLSTSSQRRTIVGSGVRSTSSWPRTRSTRHEPSGVGLFAMPVSMSREMEAE
mmetsp:Transcript_92752/g.278261  ORF Transcript_92752/g.278261 Transcript_92752/m.278261 type:complete len:216 (-) Transcript_92752:470-1117(-)